MKYYIAWFLVLGLVLLLVPSQGYCFGTSEPVNKAAQAVYQYEHWDEDVSRFLQQYENKFTPEEKRIGGWVGFGIKCLIDKKVEFIYRF